MEYGHNFIGITRLSEQVIIICDMFLAHYLKSENDMVNLSIMSNIIRNSFLEDYVLSLSGLSKIFNFNTLVLACSFPIVPSSV